MSDKSNVGVAFLIGAAIGAGIAVLYAKDRGSVTREKLKRGFDQQKQNFQEKFSEVGETLKSRIPSKEQIEATFDELTENVNEKTQGIIETLEQKLAKLKAAADAMKK